MTESSSPRSSNALSEMMRAVVTGAAGAIGSASCLRMVRNGVKVWGVDARPFDKNDGPHAAVHAELIASPLFNTGEFVTTFFFVCLSLFNHH